MAHGLRHLNGIVLKVWIALVVAFAGTSSELQAAEVPTRLIRFRVFSATPIEGLEFYSTVEPKRQRLDFYPTAISPLYSTHIDGPINFAFSREQTVAVQVVIPNEVTEALLIVTAMPAGANERPRLSVEVFNDSIARRPLGSWVILNASGLALTESVGSKSRTLPRGLNPPRTRSPAMHLELKTSFRGREYPAFSETLALNAQERGLLLLLPPVRAGSLEVQYRWLVDYGAEK